MRYKVRGSELPAMAVSDDTDEMYERCFHCGRTIFHGVSECPYCGREPSGAAFSCSYCGEELPLDAVACPYCRQYTDERGKLGTRRKPKGETRRLFVIVGWLLILGLLAGTLIGLIHWLS